jgi:hypothetical protein
MTKKSEVNYSMTKKELLALVIAFQKLYPYVHGAEVSVETNHMPLIALIHDKNPRGRLLRWALLLQEYQFNFSYRKGTKNDIVDNLSRIKT